MKVLNSFKYASQMASFVCFALFLAWQFAPELIFQIFSINSNEVALFLVKRIAALFLALAMILFLFANESNPKLQKSIAVSFAIACLLLAITGIEAILNNIAGFGILLAIIVELFFCFWFLFATRTIKFSILKS